ncbi:hypothetical protein V2J09_003694 [Rumex salicifolius]
MQKLHKKGEIIERKMSSLSMVEAKLPPGFRFHPRDDELICDYLMRRFASSESSLLIEVDLNKCEPWDLPEIACIGGKEWYFYSQRDRKYATGLRTNRATVSGYWKATGKDRAATRNGSLVGMRKTLVFYQGRAPKGKKTEWVMHEFRLEGPLGPPKLPPSKEDWVLCRVFHKSRELSGKCAIMAHTTSSSSYDMEPSSSSLPALMDSYITFNQTQQITATRDDEENENNNNNSNNIGNDSFEQVPCFSIFNPNQTIPPTLSQPFNMEQNKNSIISNPMALYHTTQFGSQMQSGVFTAAANSASMLTNGHNSNGVNSLSSNDKQVIKAVLSQLTKMEGSSPASNMKGSSSISLGEAPSSESYLSEVDLPTMWSNHY